MRRLLLIASLAGLVSIPMPAVAGPSNEVAGSTARREWLLVFFFGKASGFDYRKDLNEAGLGEDIPGGCAGSFFGYVCWDPTQYPILSQGNPGAAAVQLSVQLPSRWQFSLLAATTDPVKWQGYSSADGSRFVDLQARSRSISALAGWGKPIRIAVGPSLVERELMFDASSDQDFTIGAVGELGLRFKVHRSVVIDAAARYQWAGSRSVSHTSGSQAWEFTDLSFNTASLMLGIGWAGTR